MGRIGLAVLDFLSRLLPYRTGPPPRHSLGGDNNNEYYPEVVDMTAFTVLIIFAMADWNSNASLLLGGLCLRWWTRRAA